MIKQTNITMLKCVNKQIYTMLKCLNKQIYTMA